MSNPYQPQDPNNPYGSQPEQGYNQPYGQPQYGQPVPPPYDQYGQPIQPQYGQQPIAYGGGQPGYYTPAAPTQQRPVGVSIIAVLNWIGGGLLGMGGLFMLIIVVALGNVPTDPSGLTGPIVGLGMTLFLVLTAVFVVLSVLTIAVGVGLWRLRPWAQITQIVLGGLSILSGLTNLSSRNLDTSTLCLFIPALVVVTYLLLPTTRAAFRR